MAIVSGFPRSCSGLVCPCHLKPKLSFGIQRCDEMRLNDNKAIRIAPTRIPGGRIQYLAANRSNNKHVNSVGSDDHYQRTYDDDFTQEPFWLYLTKETIWSLRSLFVFLIEQPCQLKYIEWPSFQSTLKTATLTLVLVALLIVALSSVDSVLCYVLSLLLRRTL